MSHYINLFLSTELTCIPRFMDKYIGKYYSNTAGNALTWVFVMWNLLHFIFEQYLDGLLKKMQFKMYQRKRIVKALWYCGFYGSSFLYCIATIYRNNISIFEYRKNLPIDGGPIPPHIVLGLGLFGTFFFHSCTWDMLKHGLDLSCASYLILSFLPLFTYFTRRVELYLSLLALISISQCIFNLLRCVNATSNNIKTDTLNKGILFFTFAISALIHILAIPILFIVPLLYSLIKHSFAMPMLMLAITLIGWWIVEGFSNPVYQFGYHWVYHSPATNLKTCSGSLIECTLFPPRDDVAFNLHIIRKEIKEREAKMIARRKPKNRGVLIQTLKSGILGMVAIKRKLNKKRQSESSDSSESESERVEKESGDEESSSDENSDIEDDAKREAREYKEETARALLEDKEVSNDIVVDGDNDGKKND